MPESVAFRNPDDRDSEDQDARVSEFVGNLGAPLDDFRFSDDISLSVDSADDSDLEKITMVQEM